MPITNFDGIISSRAGGKSDDPLWVKNTSITPAAAGNWLSLLNSAGSPGPRTASGANNGAIMGHTNTGAIPLVTPAGGDLKYLLTAGISVPANTGFSALMLIDVVWLANYSVASSPGAVTMPSLTRYTTGKNLQLGCAVTTTLSAITPTVTVTYTAPEGSGHTASTGAFASALAAPKMMPLATPNLPLQSGDTGVTSVTNVAISATGTGNIDLFLYRPIMVIPTVAANTYIERDSTIQIDGLTNLPIGSDDFNAMFMLASPFGWNNSMCE